jgi:hypothetical protein
VNTAQVAFAAAAAVAFTAVVAGFVIALHGARSGYSLTCSLKWAPRPFPRTPAVVKVLAPPEPHDPDFVTEGGRM